MVIAVPITSRLRPVPFHIRIVPPQGGLTVESAALCEAVRSISKERLMRRLGTASVGTMELVEDRLRILLRL